jgi:hypothetical protein
MIDRRPSKTIQRPLSPASTRYFIGDSIIPPFKVNVPMPTKMATPPSPSSSSTGGKKTWTPLPQFYPRRMLLLVNRSGSLNSGQQHAIDL